FISEIVHTEDSFLLKLYYKFNFATEPYSEYCVEYGYKSVSRIVFAREVCSLKKITTKRVRIDNERVYVFVPFI
ncbi:hypothetical protein K4S97_11050, partial [Staphylococcus epidermidis]|nr:hypothetical protein [Staphylococcus epidermidis]